MYTHRNNDYRIKRFVYAGRVTEIAIKLEWWFLSEHIEQCKVALPILEEIDGFLVQKYKSTCRKNGFSSGQQLHTFIILNLLSAYNCIPPKTDELQPIRNENARFWLVSNHRPRLGCCWADSKLMSIKVAYCTLVKCSKLEDFTLKKEASLCKNIFRNIFKNLRGLSDIKI